MLITESPGSDLLAGHVGDGFHRRVGPGDLQGAAALEYLADIHQICTFSPRRQHLGYPGQTELRLTGGHHLLGHNVDRAFKNGHVKALLRIKALIDGGKIAGELRLGHPLELQLDLRHFGATLVCRRHLLAGIRCRCCRHAGSQNKDQEHASGQQK